MAGSDIEAKMDEFAALGSKAKMRQFIVELNENIVSFKNKVRKSGNVAALTAGYRSHLERVAAGGQSNKKSDSRAKAKQRANATGTDEDIPQEVGEPSQSRNKGKQPATTTDTDEYAPQQAGSLLSRLMVAPNIPVSRITYKCLEALGSSLNTQLMHSDDDYSAVLQPLYHAILEIVSTRALIPLSHNHRENYERLSITILRMDPIEASGILEPFMTAMGIKCSVFEVEDETDAETTAALARGIDIIWNQYNFALDRWSETFPEPSAEDMNNPQNFNEKKTLRKYARDFIEQNSYLAAGKTVQSEDYYNALETLRENWPIRKGNFAGIAQFVLNNARGEFIRIESRSRSRQPKGKGVGGDSDDCNEDGNEDGDSDDTDKEDDEDGAKEKGKGKGEEKKNESQSKRKRPVVADPDESDVASSGSKASRAERGGEERGRTLARRYPSPSKLGSQRGR